MTHKRLGEILLERELITPAQLRDALQEQTKGASTLVEDSPIARLANMILANAIRKKATHVHIEPREKDVAIRFRIDGNLHDEELLPKKLQLALIARLKLLAKLPPSPDRLPQEGRISVKLDDRIIDFLVSTVPALHGEKVVLELREVGKS